MASIERDWRDAPYTELCDHIVDEHHALLRGELPRIAKLLEKVAGRHATAKPALPELQRIFMEMREDLVDHIDREEQRLFPTCRALDNGAHAPTNGALPIPTADTLRMHEKAHANVEAKLDAMRRLSDDYRLKEAICASHRQLLEALDALDRDLRRHIHEENDVLFPRLRERFELAATA